MSKDPAKIFEDASKMGGGISVVVPLYNEEQSLLELKGELEETLQEIGEKWEIIFVDDGSVDNSMRVLNEIFEKDPEHVKIIQFRKNFGKAAALCEGFRTVSGDYVVTIDADLQDDPAEIPKLIEKLKNGVDLVSGWKKSRKDPITKTIPSKFFNWMVSLLTNIELHDFNCGLKAYRREVTEEIDIYGELHRYVPVLAKWRGYKVDEVKVNHRKRKYGKTKYGPMRFLHGFLDLLTILMITRYTRTPLHFFGLLGFILMSIGFLINLYLSIGWFFGKWIGDRPLLMLGVLMMIIGAQVIFFGLIGEMIVGLTGSKKEYSVKKWIKLDKK